MKEEMKMTFTQTITREEMKNKISMALKDPILQQGFEIICKENADLEQKLEQTEKDLADYQFNYPTIKELEKEKCELLGIIQEKDKVIEEMKKTLYEQRDCRTCKYWKLTFDVEPCKSCQKDKWELDLNAEE